MNPAPVPPRTIPTPWRVRWSLFRSRWLPVVTMLCCTALSVWIWKRHALAGQAIGEVERVKVLLSSAIDGRVGYVNGGQAKLLQHVEVGDIVAQLDDTLVKAQLRGAEAELKLLQQQAAAAGASPDQLTALRAAITAKEEQIAQFEQKIDSLVIRAPIEGSISEIFARPGQFVSAGLPILEISTDQGTSVVAFLRAEWRITARAGMEVEMRPSSDPYRVLYGRVESVASQFDAVPARQLRDPKIPEWGIPVRVSLPPDANIRPGELVRITFRARPAAAATSSDRSEAAVVVADEGGTAAPDASSRSMP